MAPTATTPPAATPGAMAAPAAAPADPHAAENRRRVHRRWVIGRPVVVIGVVRIGRIRRHWRRRHDCGGDRVPVGVVIRRDHATPSKTTAHAATAPGRMTARRRRCSVRLMMCSVGRMCICVRQRLVASIPRTSYTAAANPCRITYHDRFAAHAGERSRQAMPIEHWRTHPCKPRQRPPTAMGHRHPPSLRPPDARPSSPPPSATASNGSTSRSTAFSPSSSPSCSSPPATTSPRSCSRSPRSAWDSSCAPSALSSLASMRTAWAARLRSRSPSC